MGWLSALVQKDLMREQNQRNMELQFNQSLIGHDDPDVQEQGFQRMSAMIQDKGGKEKAKKVGDVFKTLLGIKRQASGTTPSQNPDVQAQGAPSSSQGLSQMVDDSLEGDSPYSGLMSDAAGVAQTRTAQGLGQPQVSPQQAPPQRPRITPTREQRMAQQREAATFQTGLEVDKAKQIATAQGEVQSQFNPPPSREGFDAEGNPYTDTWDRTSKAWTRQAGGTKQSEVKIINGKDGDPIGIERNGKPITNPNSMLPAEKEMFDAAQRAFEDGLTRDLTQANAMENRSLRSQEGIEDRFNRSQANTNARLAQTLSSRDFSQTNSLADDYRTETKDWNTKISSYRAIQAASDRALKDTSNSMGANDLLLLYNFIKMADPNAVRGEELALAQRGVQTSVDNLIVKAKSLLGISSNLFTLAGRKAIVEAANDTYKKAIVPEVTRINDYFEKRSSASGLPYESVAPLQLLPKPKTRGARISTDLVDQYLDAYNGDATAAREAAQRAGWTF